MFEQGDELARAVSPRPTWRAIPDPDLSEVGDEVPDGHGFETGRPRPLALFDAVRVDYSLRRLVHYTGTDWRTVQPWILLTNYHRYVDQFVSWGLANSTPAAPTSGWCCRAASMVAARRRPGEADALVAAAPWHRYQMPAYHLMRGDGAAALRWSTSASAPRTRRTSPTTSRCCGRIAG